MQFTDSHIHLQDYKTKNAQQIIADLRKHSYSRVICVSAKSEDFSSVANLVQLDSELIIPAFGIHPWYINEAPADWPELIRHFLQLYPQGILGECGFDRLKGANLAQQKAFFQTHITLAKEFNRPLNIHLVHAEDVFASIFKHLPPKFLLHSFSGSLSFLRQILHHGGYISVNPLLLRNPKFHDLIKAIPSDRLLVESDGPFQSDYTLIPDFIKQISQIKEIDILSLSSQIQQNLQNFISPSD
ncbi:MAG: TatD family hydrolase [Alphaproteobacteria bacterium]|nr:TatD family hydrolase [Alphaproteobacteria bacterium]